jgi:DNA (cytosine-5)-methyltransferase 1
LSLAGKGAGMSDTSTRSGLLWEVERILTECKGLGTLPEVLLMENVPMVHSSDNVEFFNKFQLKLEELGYKNYWQDLIATDYGIPQTRNRTFMVSILGDYNYTFPKPIPLKLKLKDMLEDEVDEKYFLSESMLNYIVSRMPSGENKITTGINMGNKNNLQNAGTLTTGEGGKPTSNFIIESDNYDYSKKEGKIIKIKNANKKGYLEAEDGDVIDISSRMEHHRGNVQKDKIQTLTTSGGNERGVVNSDLKIRKLTPKECGRLMGVKNEDIDKILKNQSDSSAYHLFGDSIVVNVLMAIFKEMI